MKDVNMDEFKEMINRLNVLQRTRSLAVKSGISWLLHLKPDEGKRVCSTKAGSPFAVELELNNVMVNAVMSTIDSESARRISQRVIALLTEQIDQLREDMIMKLAFDEDDQSTINAFDEDEDTQVS